MKLTSKLPNVGTTIFTVMSKMATDHNALNLSQGFPNFECDPLLIREVEVALRSGYNQYAPMQGDLRLREMIADKVQNLYGKRYDPGNEITVTAGATQAIFTAIAATISAGDEVIIFAPAYDCYQPAIELFGGITRTIQLRPPGFSPDWSEVEATINGKTKMIIINSPQNPSGMLFIKSDLLRLQELAERHDLLILSDEVYEHIIFDNESHQSVALFEPLAQRSFIMASFGKTFHTTGWKIGYCLAPHNLMSEFQKVHQYNVFCVNHPVQRALANYMENPECYLTLPSFYQEKRDYFLTLIRNSRFQFIPSQGTYFQLLDYSTISMEPDTLFAERLTKDFKIATIPTSVFNKDGMDFKQVRICFAKTQETLKMAANILNSI